MPVLRSAILAASLMVVVAVVVGPSDAPSGGVVLVGTALVLFALDYLLVARPALSEPRTWITSSGPTVARRPSSSVTV